MPAVYRFLLPPPQCLVTFFYAVDALCTSLSTDCPLPPHAENPRPHDPMQLRTVSRRAPPNSSHPAHPFLLQRPLLVVELLGEKAPVPPNEEEGVEGATGQGHVAWRATARRAKQAHGGVMVTAKRTEEIQEGEDK